MEIRSLSLIGFRNYTELSLFFHGGLNVFVGENAQGKTNLLEAIYFSVLGRSFRTFKDRELIHLRSNQAYSCCVWESERLEKKLEQMLDRNRAKRIKLNGKEIRSLKELSDETPMVVFSPDDLSMVKGAPKGRRDFLDEAISSLRKEYGFLLTRYQKVLSQRNNLLKEPKLQREFLDVFDFQLAEYGAKLIRYRKLYLKKLERAATEILSELSGHRDDLKMFYVSSAELPEEEEKLGNAFLKELKSSFDRDRMLQSTTVGPHRDEFSMYIGDRDARMYGSQGQQRSLVLSLKLGLLKMMEEEGKRRPVLLLDDVFSELDEKRRFYLVKYIQRLQTFITTTSAEELKELSEIPKAVYSVASGVVSQR